MTPTKRNRHSSKSVVIGRFPVTRPGISSSPPPTACGSTSASAPIAAPTTRAGTNGTFRNVSATQSSRNSNVRLKTIPSPPRNTPNTRKAGSSDSGISALSSLSCGAVPPTSSMPMALAAEAMMTAV